MILRKIFIALSILSVGYVVAEELPPNSVKQTIDFRASKGVFTYYNGKDIPDEYAQEILNVDLTRNGGSLSPRGGWNNIANLADHGDSYSPGALFIFVSSTSHKYLVAKQSDIWRYVDLLTESPHSFSLNATNFAADGISANSNFYLLMQDSNMVKVGESSAVNGTLWNLTVSTTVRGQMFGRHLDRYLVAGDSAAVLTVYFSDPDNIEAFPALNTFEITGVKGYDYITGLGEPLLGSLPIYTRNSTRILQGTVFPDRETAGNVVVRVVSDNIGCLSHKSIKNLKNNKQYFLSGGQDGQFPGIYAFNGITVSEKTKGQRSLFKNAIAFATSTPRDQDTRTVTPSAFIYRDKYCTSFTTSNPFPSGIYNSTVVNVSKLMVCVDENDIVEVYQHGDLVTFNTGANLEELGYFHFDDGDSIDGKTYAIGGDNGGELSKNARDRIFQLDSGDMDNISESGANPFSVNWKYKSKDFAMGDEGRPKSPNRAYLSYQFWPTTFTIKANYDFGTSSSTWIINSTTNYRVGGTGFFDNGSIRTVAYSSTTVTSKLVFPQSKKFKFVNFEIFGTTYSSIYNIDFYATKEPLE